MSTKLSSCCKVKVVVSTSDEGTSCHICTECKKPCDAVSCTPLEVEEKICGKHVSTGTGKIDGHVCFNKLPCPIHSKADEGKCMWCGKTLDEHTEFPMENMTPRVPCLMLKRKFVVYENIDPMADIPEEVDKIVSPKNKGEEPWVEEFDGKFDYMLNFIEAQTGFSERENLKSFIRKKIEETRAKYQVEGNGRGGDQVL